MCRYPDRLNLWGFVMWRLRRLVVVGLVLALVAAVLVNSGPASVAQEAEPAVDEPQPDAPDPLPPGANAVVAGVGESGFVDGPSEPTPA